MPREGYDGPDPRNRFGDEGPLAAATAAMYPNVEHVLIRSGPASPIDGFDRNFFLFDRPVQNPANTVWILAIDQAARERKLNIMLIGELGNVTVSHYGYELLPEYLCAGRLFKLWREAAMLVAKTGMRWRGAMAQIFGPFMPAWLWQWANDTFNDHKWDVLNYTAIAAERLTELKLQELAGGTRTRLSLRPWKTSFGLRHTFMRRGDRGNMNKGILAGWGNRPARPIRG